METKYRMHPALVVFLCMGLLSHDVSAVFLIGHTILSKAIVLKSALLAKKGMVLGAAVLTPALASAAVTKGLALAAAAGPVAIASLAAKPFIVGPAITGILALKAGIGILVLKRGVLTLVRNILGAKIIVAKIVIGKALAAKVAILAGKKALLLAKVAAVATAGAAAGSAARSFAIGIASNAKAIGTGAINTGKAILNFGSSGVSALTTGVASSATTGVEFIRSLKRPHVVVETHHYAVPVPYPVYGSSQPALVQPTPVEAHGIGSEPVNIPLATSDLSLQGFAEQMVPESYATPDQPLPENFVIPEQSFPESYGVVPESYAVPQPVVPESYAAPQPMVLESYAAPQPMVPESYAAPDLPLSNPVTHGGKSHGSTYTMFIQPAGPVESYPIHPSPAQVIEPTLIVQHDSQLETLLRSAKALDYPDEPVQRVAVPKAIHPE